MRRMTGAWLIFCLIALPKMIGSFHNSDFRFPPPDPSGTVRQNVPHTNDFPPENSASVRDKLPARFLDEPFVYFSTAPAESLVLLPGLGPVLAARICKSRGGKRSFNSWDDLQRVNGIGPKTVSRFRRLVEKQ